MGFSRRLPDRLAPNRIADLRARLAGAGAPLVDLTETNPTRAGFSYPPGILDALASPAALTYDPQPLGWAPAREAVASEYARRGPAVKASDVVLTSSTSEGYSLLFKLLCDPGDRVLVPQPSYPLFDHLARLDLVETAPYTLDLDAGWRIDLESVARAVNGRTRAIVVVSPNNPTGSLVTPGELDALAAIAARHDLALIGDEVFADYPIDPLGEGASVMGRRDILSFSLGGLSKSAGLPQVKLGWMAVAGTESRRREALARIEYIADAYLSVSTPVQVAARDLLAAGAAVRRAIAERIRGNYHALNGRAARAPACRALRVEGGWSAVLQTPAIRSEEDLVLDLLERDGVIVHPGYFFDFPRESFLVVSLLVEPALFAEGVDRIIARASV